MIPTLGTPVFQLDVEGNSVNVYFWDDEISLNTAANRIVNTGKDSAAAYVAFRTAEGWTRELHFVRDWLGVGYVTHELVHLGIHLISWVNPGEIEVEREEQFCDLVEEAARQFWDKRYALSDGVNAAEATYEQIRQDAEPAS
jgi:hypothetical protein